MSWLGKNIYIINRYGNLDPDIDKLFMYIFPIFRGAGMFNYFDLFEIFM